MPVAPTRASKFLKIFLAKVIHSPGVTTPGHPTPPREFQEAHRAFFIVEAGRTAPTHPPSHGESTRLSRSARPGTTIVTPKQSPGRIPQGDPATRHPGLHRAGNRDSPTSPGDITKNRIRNPDAASSYALLQNRKMTQSRVVGAAHPQECIHEHAGNGDIHPNRESDAGPALVHLVKPLDRGDHGPRNKKDQ